MSRIINIDNIDVWKEKIHKFRFNKRRLTLVDEDGKYRNYMFIVIENIETKEMKITGYSKYFIIELRNRSLSILETHAKVIINFLNYVFFDNYDKYKIKKIENLNVDHGNDFLRDYSAGKVGNSVKTKDTVQKAEYILNRFYIFLASECQNMSILDNKLNTNDFEKNFRIKDKRKNSHEKKESLFMVIYPEHIPAKRIKYISSFLFSEILRVCEIYYPELKLAICLQAFGGLRKGEVCNVTKDKIQYEKLMDRYTWFTIDLRAVKNIRSDGKCVGGIKRKRIQPIHPVFLKILTRVYQQHLELIKHWDNPYGALFINKNGDAMIEQSYEKKIKRIINLLLIRLKNNGDFNSLSEMNLLLSGRINTHIFRHFFTKFIFQLEKHTPSYEIAYWRGDSSLDSALRYLGNNPVVDEKIQQIQEEIFGDFSSFN